MALIVQHIEPERGQKFLKEVFSAYGTIVRCEIPTRRDGKPREIALIDFSTDEEAQAAIKALNNARVGNRIFTVTLRSVFEKRGNRAESDSDDFLPKEEEEEVIERAYQKFPRRPLEGEDILIPRPCTPPQSFLSSPPKPL